MLQINTKQIFKAMFLFASTILIATGCANTAVKNQNDIHILKVNSSKAKILNAELFQLGDKWVLKGRINRLPSYRGPTYGHLHISVINHQGKTLTEHDVNYMRESRNSITASFRKELTINLAANSTIKITHFPTKTH
ncbi:hypothetical protein [Thiomicrorhabdus sediminis]|uniref:Lipoprotein n=1 Tax=Thiomicrorhabdus sediminis TaxID=2580412 RepID=A0A4P9K7G3_9GAMM|nr:hypothetical protein [Thiomicrorhabdus sediminis]QCU90989.1 hypothetical protein FE785_10320 [Thiomicrorhabdus sediminis]